MPWTEVNANDPAVPTCANLLSIAHPENTSVTANNINGRLNPNYFRLFAWSANSGGPITIALAFYKTIKGGSRQWWCISEGCQPPATGQTYSIIKAQCLVFYNQMQPGELLVTVDDASRVSVPYNPNRFNPQKWEVDNSAEQLINDTTVTKKNLGTEPAYAGFAKCLPPGAQIVFTQLDI
jgi:hypothetical protein